MTCLNSERIDLTEDERRGFHFGRGVLSIHNLAIDEQNTVVLSRLFRRLFLEKLVATHAAGRLQFFGAHANLADHDAFAEYLTPSRGVEWVVYSKRPFGGPEAVLAYLSRYTHRVAISNSRLLACDGAGVAFKIQGLPRRWPRAAKGHEARDRRVHPPLPPTIVSSA